MAEHVFMFFQKMSDGPQNIKGSISGEFSGNGIVSKRQKNIDGKIEGEFKGILERKNIVRSEKISQLDKPEYRYSDKINYNTSIINAVYHHLNKNTTDDSQIKFSTIIDFYDDKSEENNKKTIEMMKQYLHYDENKVNEDGVPDNFKLIKYNNDDLNDYTKFLKRINEDYEFKENSCVHIAMNGGQRDTMMFIATLTQVLSHKNIESHMYYEDSRDTVTERNVSYYDLLRAVDLFTETGNPRKLVALYKDEAVLSDLLKYMKQFNEKIQVCRKVNSESNDEKASIQYVYNNLISEITMLQTKITENNDEELSRKFKVSSLPIILPILKKAFVNEEWNNANLENPREIDLLNIVKWCHDNNLISIGFFIFRAEMTSFIENCQNFLDVEFISANDLSNLISTIKFEYNSSPNSDNTNSDEEENSERFFVSQIKYYRKSQSFSEKLDLLMTFFAAYINNRMKNDEELKNYKRDGQSMAKENRIKVIKEESLRKFGFIFDSKDLEATYRIIMVCSLIRRVRNTLAHSDGRPLISGVYSYLNEIIKEYNDRLKKRKSLNLLPEEITIDTIFSDEYDIHTIDSSDENYYQVCHVLLGFLYEDMYEHYKNTRGDAK